MRRFRFHASSRERAVLRKNLTSCLTFAFNPAIMRTFNGQSGFSCISYRRIVKIAAREVADFDRQKARNVMEHLLKGGLSKEEGAVKSYFFCQFFKRI